MARISKRFVDETLWPEFEEISETLRGHLDSVTERQVGRLRGEQPVLGRMGGETV